MVDNDKSQKLMGDKLGTVDFGAMVKESALK
jgi:hypothetical protein